MAVDLTQLAAALRLGNGVAAPSEPIAGILQRTLGVATALVTIWAPDAPDVVQDEAIVRVSAFLYDAPPAATGDRYAHAWRSSGAAGLCSAWTSKRAGVAGDAALSSPSAGTGI